MTREEIIDFFKSEGKIRFDELVNFKFDYSAHFDEKRNYQRWRLKRTE
jgi:hypothetical protein